MYDALMDIYDDHILIGLSRNAKLRHIPKNRLFQVYASLFL